MYLSKLEWKEPGRAVLPEQFCVGLELFNVPRFTGTCVLGDFQLTKLEENYYGEMYAITAM